MYFSKSVYIRSAWGLIALAFIFIRALHGQAVIAPVEDVFFYTFGGGEGCNTFIKYDITSVPDDMVIDSVFLTAFVYQINGGWDGNMDFWNVNDQDWNESDSCGLIWNLATSDSTHQAGGFGMSTGWTQSVDLKAIFLTDYDMGNTYCSIKMKDPDEMTSVPMPGSYPFDLNDSLMVGDRAIGTIGYIVFYPHEWSNAPPWLVVFYHDVGVFEDKSKIAGLTLNVYPNPFRRNIEINFTNQLPVACTELKIYNSAGDLVRMFSSEKDRFNTAEGSVLWDGRDFSGRQLPAGVYLCKFKAGQGIVIRKICFIK